MTSRKTRLFTRSYGAIACAALLALFAVPTFNLAFGEAETSRQDEQRFVQVAARTKHQRSKIANLGVSIEAIRSDSIWGFATDEMVTDLKRSGFRVLGVHDKSVARGGHETSFGTDGFPAGDERYHDYPETTAFLRALVAKHPQISQLDSIGKSVEGRDIWALHINTTKSERRARKSAKPGAIFMGTHHAREHLSTEIPLLLAEHLLKNKNKPAVRTLLEERDIWIIPMVNPDGVEHDIATGQYQLWRKNRRDNKDGNFGVDLNRNYGFKWGTGGSSKNTASEVYMGPSPFSEPESSAIRDFVTARKDNVKVLLSFHTFSELILYPWGHSNDKIGNKKDYDVFVKMAETMAKWNGYTPEQASDLYIASGDTVDWAYGEHGIFAFTFELSPKSAFFSPPHKGFYPGPGAIDKTFKANLEPVMYMLSVADDPYKVIDETTPTRRRQSTLKNYVEPELEEEYFGKAHPLPALPNL